MHLFIVASLCFRHWSSNPFHVDTLVSMLGTGRLSLAGGVALCHMGNCRQCIAFLTEVLTCEKHLLSIQDIEGLATGDVLLLGGGRALHQSAPACRHASLPFVFSESQLLFPRGGKSFVRARARGALPQGTYPRHA